MGCVDWFYNTATRWLLLVPDRDQHQSNSSRLVLLQGQRLFQDKKPSPKIYISSNLSQKQLPRERRRHEGVRLRPTR